jgi:hypothetical protein
MGMTIAGAFDVYVKKIGTREKEEKSAEKAKGEK